MIGQEGRSPLREVRVPAVSYSRFQISNGEKSKFCGSFFPAQLSCRVPPRHGDIMAKPTRDTQYVWPRAKVEAQDALQAIEQKMEYGRLEPENAKLWFERATVLGAAGNMREAVDALSRAIAVDPFCGIYYRWRGHRHLNCGDVADACADFSVASRLLPESWDVWYHLGLCNTVLGRRQAAEYAHKKCWEMHMVDQKRIPLVNWSWINLSLMGRREEADGLLRRYVAPDMEVGPNLSYLLMCLTYKGERAPERLLEPREGDAEPMLGVMTQAFGLANYYLIQGDRAKYDETIDYIVENGKDGAWNCFGYSAACYIQRSR